MAVRGFMNDAFDGWSRAVLLAIAVALSGCPAPVTPGGDGDGTSSGDEPGATLGAVDSSTGVSGSATATGGGDATGTSASESSGQGSSGGPATPCEAGCAKWAACERIPYEDCVLECDGYFDEIAGFRACEQAAVDLWTCFGVARCGAFESECEAEIEAEYVACEEGLGCSTEAGGAIDGSSCSITQTCGDGLERELDCFDGTCSCTESGVVTGSCPQQDICSELADVPPRQLDALVDEFLFECCGWDPPVPPGEG